MPQICPLCGAEFPSGEQCRDRFDLCLALEFENPAAFGSVHHLTVVCYMLQHNAYSRDAWLEGRKMLAQFVREEATPAEMRKQGRSKLNSQRRTGSVTRCEKLPNFEAITWSCTIADIRRDDPQTYCADVNLWARSVLRDTETLMQALGMQP